MFTRPFAVIDRRAVPRFKTRFPAELAFGTVLVPATVRDLSIKGCGVIISAEDMDLPDVIGCRGILRLAATGEKAFGLMLPVILRNIRVEGSARAYGLEFVPLANYQNHRLAAVLELIAVSR